MGNQSDGDFLDWRHSHQMKAEPNLPSHSIDCTALCRTLIRDRNAKDLSQVVHNGHELTDDEPERMVPGYMPITSLPQVAKDRRRTRKIWCHKTQPPTVPVLCHLDRPEQLLIPRRAPTLCHSQMRLLPR